MKVLSNKFIIRMVGGTLAAAIIATGFSTPLSVSAKENTKAVVSEKTGAEDITNCKTVAYKAVKYTVTDKALKNAKADVKIRANGKTIKAKGLTVKGKQKKKTVNVTYVPAKELAKALGAKYTVKKNSVSISTGLAKVSFDKKADGYYFATERKGACGMTGPLGYGKPYQRNKVLYVPVGVFENLYCNFTSSQATVKQKNKVLTVKYQPKDGKKAKK